jgi:tetratricopeptide (TPR) repeat protein
LAVAPDDLLLACRLANCYVGSGELFKANELLSGLLARYPSVGELYLLRGLVLYQLRHDAQAEADLHLCLGLAPNSAQALAALGDIYRDRELYEEAADFVDRAYQLAPDDIHVARARAYLSLALRDWGKAADILAEVLQQAPSDVVAAVNRVAALIESGNALAAIDALEDALRVGASEPWVHEMLGAMFAQRGDWKIAVENLEASVAREPTSTTGWNILIVAYSKLGEMEKAEAAAKKILEIDPHHVNALINLGGLKIDLGFHDEGIQLFQRALAQAPESPAAYSGLLFGMLFSSEVPVKDILEAAANAWGADPDDLSDLPMFRR